MKTQPLKMSFSMHKVALLLVNAYLLCYNCLNKCKLAIKNSNTLLRRKKVLHIFVIRVFTENNEIDKLVK